MIQEKVVNLQPKSTLLTENNNTNNTNNNNDGDFSILSMLQCHFLDEKEDTTTATTMNVMECLRQVFRRSKQRPAPIVQKVQLLLLNQVKPNNQIRAAHATLLMPDYWNNPKSPANDDDGGNKTRSTCCCCCCWYMKRIATTMWFVQLLLEYQSIPYSNDNDYSKHDEPLLDTDEAHSMVLTLLQNLSKAILQQLLQQQQQHDEECQYASTVISFCIGAHLDVVNPYVSTFPFLLSPLFKGICELLLLWTNNNNNAQQTTTTVVAVVPPPELIEETLRAVLVYLVEGYQQVNKTIVRTDYNILSAPSPTHCQQQQVFPIKVLSFLVTKCSILLRVHVASHQTATASDDNSSSDSTLNTVVPDIVTVLLQLRGLLLAATSQWKQQQQHSTTFTTTTTTTTAQEDAFFVQAYQQLETKVEQCLLNSWLQKPLNDGLVNRPNVNRLLRLRHAPTKSSSSSIPKQLAWLSFVIGKAWIVLRLLERMVVDASSHSTRTEPLLRDCDTQSLLLQLCEELLLFSVPQCGDDASSSTLWSRCLDAMSSATFLCHVHDNNNNKTPSQLHCLLLKWLAPPSSAKCSSSSALLHPVTRELVMTLIHMHTLRLGQAHHHGHDIRNQSPRSTAELSPGNNTTTAPATTAEMSEYPPPVKSIMSLLAKLLFDPRTMMEHRRNVAGVILQFIHGHVSTDTNSLQHGMSVMMQQAVGRELEQCLKNDITSGKRKRRRQEIHDISRKSLLASFDNKDVDTIAYVLRNVFVFDRSSLDRELASLARDLDNFGSSTSTDRHLTYTIGGRSRNAMSLLFSLQSGAAVSAINENADAQTRSKVLYQKTGVDVKSFSLSLLQWMEVEQQSQSLRATKSSLGTKDSVIVACLLFLRSTFRHFTDTHLSRTVHILKFNASAVEKTLRSPSSTIGERQGAASIGFAIALLLADIASPIPVNCPPIILEKIATAYTSLFNCKAWPMDARCVTSLLRLASTISAKHKVILPKCIPANRQGLLQCRLQGTIHRDAQSHNTEAMSTKVSDECNKALLSLIPARKNCDSLYAAGPNDEIVQGSYILTLPTTNGRTAKVIFAPGNDSLQDIKNMLGADDMDNIEIRKLQKVRLVGNGQGCLLVSTVLEVP